MAPHPVKSSKREFYARGARDVRGRDGATGGLIYADMDGMLVGT